MVGAAGCFLLIVSVVVTAMAAFIFFAIPADAAAAWKEFAALEEVRTAFAASRVEIDIVLVAAAAAAAGGGVLGSTVSGVQLSVDDTADDLVNVAAAAAGGGVLGGTVSAVDDTADDAAPISLSVTTAPLSRTILLAAAAVGAGCGVSVIVTLGSITGVASCTIIFSRLGVSGLCRPSSRRL